MSSNPAGLSNESSAMRFSLPTARGIFDSRPILYLRRALRSGSYPLRGIVYFLRHPEFYPLFSGRLLPLSIISCLVYFILFTFAFLPQYAFLAIFHGWGAWANAVVLVLGEGLVIIQGLFEGFFVDECRVDVFDVGQSPVTVHSLYLLLLLSHFLLPRSLTLICAGNSDQPGSGRAHCTASSPLPRCPKLGQDAGQADQSCRIPAVECGPDR